MLLSEKYLVGCVLIIVLLMVNACTREKALNPNSGYPTAIAKIILTRCSTPGCHTTASKGAAADLDLSTWQKLFEGGSGGAVCVPYSPDESSLFLYCNTFSDLGQQLKPVMPYNQSPLSKDEVLLLKNWIAAGAPDKNGTIAFSETNASKILFSNQGCDLLGVIDAQTSLVSRYVKIGSDAANIESPHYITVSPDKSFYCVVFAGGNVLQKINATDNTVMGTVNLGAAAGWNAAYITPDSKHAYAVDFLNQGSIAYIDLQNMSLLKLYTGSIFTFPHGIAGSVTGDTIYVTAQYGNFIFKIDVSDPYFPDVQQVVMQTGATPVTTSSIDPHQIIFTPDFKKYFVSCEKSNEVRVFQASNDSLLSIIPVGTKPQEFSLSTSKPYLFVTNTEDLNCTGSICQGSVSVINYNTHTLIKTINAGFYQPHGLAVDDANGVVYVANRNTGASGPAPHHTSVCGGRNGFMLKIDLNTLELVPGYKTELSVDPYSVNIIR